ncbi:hypothetical protein CDAR_303711 [Caerostris darwini]|uniref:Uncharacterized protein n=1 Tax=Caerostris darwini TaxID=1538125 RepID=A0AAV4T4R8_9ARAC|nr:hypothetical protein CDAR_303711 [Caerostris darwini]
MKERPAKMYARAKCRFLRHTSPRLDMAKGQGSPRKNSSFQINAIIRQLYAIACWKSGIYPGEGGNKDKNRLVGGPLSVCLSDKGSGRGTPLASAHPVIRLLLLVTPNHEIAGNRKGVVSIISMSSA